jgi:REP element-mobilizing transposase RayT
VEVYVHLVWATWDRLPLVSPELRPGIYAAIHAECAAAKAEVIAIGGTEDHVHLLVRLPATIALSALVKQVKGVSSHLVTDALTQGDEFRWQGAYAAFSVSPADVPRIRDYVLRQEEHHHARTADPDLELDMTGDSTP